MVDNLLQKRPFIISEGQPKKLKRIPVSENAFQEEWLQRLLQTSPQLLPVDEIDPAFSPLVCIGREVRTPAGPIDNLYISPKGYITIVETKLWRNPEARRAVVGQILDYTKELAQFSYEDLDKCVRKYNKSYLNQDCGLFEMMVKKEFFKQENENLFIDLVEKNLNNARFLLLIVGDGIKEGVWRMTKFLNETPNMQYTLGLVQLEVYQLPNDERLVIPNLLLQTKIVERGVFRFEKGEITPVIEREDLPIVKNAIKDEITIEDFSEMLLKNTPSINENDFSNFMNDLEDLGYIVSIRKKYLVVKYPLPGSKQPLNIIYFSTEPEIGAYKNKGSFEKDLEKRGYSQEIAKYFYDNLRKYLLPTDNKGNSINHDLARIIKDKEDVLPIFEKLTNYF